MKFITRSLLALFLFSGVVGCVEHKGPMERAGERVDEIGDNIAEGQNPLKKKGPMERAGERVDDAVNGRE